MIPGEKEYNYERAYQSGKQAKSLWKYIPQKIEDAIDETMIDSDGYWIYLADGWTAYDGGEDCGIIHCYTISDLKEDIATISRRTVS